MFKSAIPVLHVSSAAAAEKFYCDCLGFHQTFAYRIDEPNPDPCYMGLIRDGVKLHVSSFPAMGFRAEWFSYSSIAWTSCMRSSSRKTFQSPSHLPIRVGVIERCTWRTLTATAFALSATIVANKKLLDPGIGSSLYTLWSNWHERRKEFLSFR